MIIFKKDGELTRWLSGQRKEGKSIGFVPTMGALHRGHISLIDISKESMGLTVVSIFVNPTQFNDPKDFQKYPITMEKDIEKLETAGVDILFLPSVEEMYPQGTTDLERYDLGPLETILEGKFRPGHFQGVCQVVSRLLDIVQPEEIFMGEKDYQQCMVIARLLAIKGIKTILRTCPILRELDGLAMSSRNMRLSPAERENAPAIYLVLSSLRQNWQTLKAKKDQDIEGPFLRIRQGTWIEAARETLEGFHFRIDYIEIADAHTLNPEVEGGLQGKAIALVAAFQGEVRLIDNMIL